MFTMGLTSFAKFCVLTPGRLHVVAPSMCFVPTMESLACEHRLPIHGLMVFSEQRPLIPISSEDAQENRRVRIL